MAQHSGDRTTAMGPFTRWPTGEGVGFDYFYGFLAGETSQWEPRLYENFNPIEPPRDPKYHLSEDLADKAITWMNRHHAFSPDKPFFMYWAPGLHMGRTTFSRSGPTNTKGASMTAGMSCASAEAATHREINGPAQGWGFRLPRLDVTITSVEL